MSIKKEFIRGRNTVIVFNLQILFPAGYPRPAVKDMPMTDERSVLGLSTIRRNRGITLEQIANATKISVRLLAAIEQGEFSKLPGGIYDTSYIRQYARAIDYDESAILAAYHLEKGADAPADTPSRGFFSAFRTA
jgi:hypothetical protein